MDEAKAKELVGKTVSYSQGRGTKQGVVTGFKGNVVTIDNGTTKVNRKSDLVKVLK